VGIRLLRVANGLVMQDPEEFLRKVREALGAGTDPSPVPRRPEKAPSRATLSPGERAVC
jgi:hypothetical protein